MWSVPGPLCARARVFIYATLDDASNGRARSTCLGVRVPTAAARAPAVRSDRRARPRAHARPSTFIRDGGVTTPGILRNP